MAERLYLVKLRGMQSNPTGPAWGMAYVVAMDPSEAYQKVKRQLDERNIGFRSN
jgi:hypothetical protein